MYLEPETDAKNEGCNAGDEPAEEGVEREGHAMSKVKFVLLSFWPNLICIYIVKLNLKI